MSKLNLKSNSKIDWYSRWNFAITLGDIRIFMRRWHEVELSIYDVIISQKVPMENESSISLGGNNNFTHTLCAKIILGKKKHFE